ncbi:probable polygalacturonase At3g15720 [Camellia sinensis]|uniref:probable polygalacturonase At3g15720 n=1 Tax=Camellia sinensis TaxID=4442 RepID=UPI0010362006|nr:probable polygalacturonase At3g15720 [Camellia sinensis]
MKKNNVLLFCIVFFLVSAISVACHNQTFNVLNFGAVGDGSTDDTQIGGNLTAPSHPSKWKCNGSNCRQWIGFTEINGLYIYGSRTINAQGTKWWGSSNVNHTRKARSLLSHFI